VITGQFQALGEALADVLSHYDPGPEGLSGVTQCVIALTHPEWAWYGWVIEAASDSVGAGSSAVVTLVTVPLDERWILESIRLNRNSGDNTVNFISAIQPADYRDGDGTEILAQLTVADPVIFWPDTGQQTLSLLSPLPVLLEPGAIIQLAPSGAGVAASVWNYVIRMRRTKLIRARIPSIGA